MTSMTTLILGHASRTPKTLYPDGDTSNSDGLKVGMFINYRSSNQFTSTTWECIGRDMLGGQPRWLLVPYDPRSGETGSPQGYWHRESGWFNGDVQYWAESVFLEYDPKQQGDREDDV